MNTIQHRWFPPSRASAGRSVATLLLLALIARPLRAATFTWDGGGTNDFLSTAANWNPNAAPPFDGTADLVFAGSTRLNPFVLGTTWSIHGLSFDSSAAAFSIFGNPWHLGAGGITNNSAATETLNNIYVDSAQTWNAAAGDLKFNSMYASGAERTLTIDGVHNTTISGGIDNGSGEMSALDLMKIGTGSLTLNGGVAKRLGSGLNLSDGTVTLSGAPVNSTTALVSLEGNLLIGIAGLDDQNAVLNVNLSSPGLALTQIAGGIISIGGGPPVSPQTGIYVGAATGGPAALSIGNGGIVETGATGLTVHSTGTVNIGSATTTGTLKTYGNVVVDGGTLNQYYGSSFVPYAMTTLTVQNGGRVHFDNAYTFNSGRFATVTGTNSVLETADGFIVDTGSLFVQDGGAVSAGSVVDVGRNANGALKVDGPGSLLYAAGGIASVWGANGQEADIIIDHQAAVHYDGGLSLVSGTGIVYASINNGAQLTAGPMLSLNAGDSGSLSLIQIGHPNNDAGGAAIKIDAGGQLIIGTSFTHYTGNSAPLSVYPGASLIVGTGGTTHLNKTGYLVIDGGTVDLQNLPVYDGQLLFYSGTLSYRGYLDVGSDTVADIRALGAGSQTIDNNRSLTLSQGTYIHNGYSLTIAGGTLNTSFVYTSNFSSLYGTLNFQSGTLGITGPDGVRIGTDQTSLEIFGASFSAPTGKTLNVTNSLVLETSGSLVVSGGTVTAGSLVNNNVIVSYGGVLSTGGLSNNGRINFVTGVSHVYGNVTNNSHDRGITISGSDDGPANVIFYNNVTNTAGALFSVSAGSTVDFFGTYNGDGITGDGDKYFGGEVNPGFSPAAIAFGGNVTLDASAKLNIELGGTTAGTQFDQVAVANGLTLGGSLNVSLINDFSPAAGDTFDILDWATLSGVFSTIDLPDLAAGLAWNTSQLYTTGVLSITAALPGDFDGNGIVSAADYVVWRNGLGTIYTEADYDAWRSHFGDTAAGGAAHISQSSVPEPACSALFVSALMVVVAGRYKSQRRKTAIASDPILQEGYCRVISGDHVRKR